jgi:hypothetical protein
MILDPLQRRYGYGAARLPVERPVGGISLSQLARRPVDRESTFAVFPALLCAGVAFLLALAGQLEAPRSALVSSFTIAETSPIEIEFWSEALPEIEPARNEEPIPTPKLVPSIVEVEIETEAKPNPTAAPLDARTFAIRALVDPTPDPVFRRERTNGPRPSTRSSRPRPELALAGHRPPKPTNLNENEETANLHWAEAARPHAISGTHERDSMPAWSPANERRAFLAALDANGKLGQIAPPEAPRPPVAAAVEIAAVSDSVRKDLDWGVLTTGWHEVPLDELPDCRPPGRQDLLKKRILLAAPFKQECSHQDGSYRFLETRNLGAFLMWSRPIPDRPDGQRQVRDVCDVLEQALRCLDESSIEESSAL